MVNRLTLALISLSLVAAVSAEAAIVNTLRGFSEGGPGWSGGLSGSFGASGGNTEETSFQAGAHLQWRGGSERIRLMGSGKRTSSKGTETAKAVMGHLRHNHRLSDKWNTLSFLQIQENPFQRLKSRTLLGVGLRVDLLRNSSGELVLGAAHMWEREHLENVGEPTDQQRLSLFMSSVVVLRPGVDLDGVLYYQPAWSEFSDCRLFGKIDLEVSLSKDLTLFTGVQVEHDSRPAMLVQQTDWETSTGFKMSF